MSELKLDRTNIVDFIADIFERRGVESYLGEAVTMSEHMLQGAHFAENAGELSLFNKKLLMLASAHFQLLTHHALLSSPGYLSFLSGYEDH